MKFFIMRFRPTPVVCQFLSVF